MQTNNKEGAEWRYVMQVCGPEQMTIREVKQGEIAPLPETDDLQPNVRCSCLRN